MGFFKKIKKAVKKVVKKVVKPAAKVVAAPVTLTTKAAVNLVTAKKPLVAAATVVKQAALGVTGIAIGEAIKKVGGEKAKAIYEQAYFTVGGAVAGVYGGVAVGLATKAVTQAANYSMQASARASLASQAVAVSKPGGQNMGLDLGGILKSVGGIFGGNQNPYFNTVSNVANLASSFIPVKTTPTMPMAQPVVQTMAAAAPAMRAVGAVVSRGFFSKFPNLATKIQKYRNMGMDVTRTKLYSMMRRFGPEFLVTAGILTAVEINELALAGSGRRRMNPGNVKALRRSMRRLESFHKLCVTSDKLRRPRARAKSKC